MTQNPGFYNKNNFSKDVYWLLLIFLIVFQAHKAATAGTLVCLKCNSEKGLGGIGLDQGAMKDHGSTELLSWGFIQLESVKGNRVTQVDHIPYFSLAPPDAVNKRLSDSSAQYCPILATSHLVWLFFSPLTNSVFHGAHSLKHQSCIYIHTKDSHGIFSEM